MANANSQSKVIARRIHTFMMMVATALLVSACGANKPKSSAPPNWTVQPPKAPGQAYGVGSAEIYGDRTEAVKRAEDAARLDLVKQLRVTISGELTSEIYEKQATGAETVVIKEMRNKVRSKVKPVELDEISREKSYISDDNKYAYALVVLDRTKAAARLRRQMSDVESRLDDIARLPSQADTLQELQQRLPALPLFEQWRRYADKYQLVSESRTAPTLFPNLVELESKIGQLLKQIRVTLQPTNEPARSVTAGISDRLTDMGLRIDTQVSNVDVVFEYKVTLRPVEKQGTYYVFAEGNVKLKDKQGRVLSSLTREVKGVSAYEDLALKKASQQLGNLIGSTLADTLVTRLD